MMLYGCTSLNSVRIGESVTEIGESAFYGCKTLIGIYVSKNVSFVAKNAFYGCSSLKNVEYGGTESRKNTVIIANGNDKFSALFRGSDNDSN